MDPWGDLLERQEVTAAIGRVVTRIAAGGHGGLFVAGEAGLGKTSLVDGACRLAAAAGLAVGRARGHPMETGLPFGLLAQALDGAGAGGLLGEDELGPTSAGDRAARFYRVLRWLQRRTGPALLLAVDDMQWADADSVALVTFLGRRMESVPFGLIAGLRPWPPGAYETAKGLVHDGHGHLLRLAPLSAEAAGALLEQRVGRPVAKPVRQRAFLLSAGNPLLLEQLAVTVGRGESVPETGQAGAAGFGQGVLLARFAGLPKAGMRCAQAASVLGTSFHPEIAAQVAGLNGADVDAAIESLAGGGLIEQQPGCLADFVHPLFRQALYDDLSGPTRARLHARAFAVLHARGLDAQAAEHATAARLVGDMDAAAVLERTGGAALRAGALATAMEWLDAAVAMAGDRAGLGLLLAQAEALLVGGRPGPAISAYERLLSRPAVPVDAQVKALWMCGRAMVMTGDHKRAAAAFGEAARLAETDDPGTAVAVLLDATFSAMISAGPKRALLPAGRARELAASLGPWQRVSAEAVWGEAAVQTGDPAGIAATEAAAPWLLPGSVGPDGAASGAKAAWGSVSSFAYIAALTERLTESERAFATLRVSADQASQPEPVAILANGHGFVLTRMGRLDQALEAINAALGLTDLAPVVHSFAGVGRAHIQLYRGELDDSAHWCQLIEATATARGEWNALLFLWDVRGHRRLREGAAAEACELYVRLEATLRQMGIGEPCLPPWPRHAIGAYLAAGRPADAERVLSWLEKTAGPLPCRFPRIAAATGRAWLAESRGDLAEAQAHFRAALAFHEEVDLPVELVETLLAYGGFLRRSGRPTAARSQLTRAAETADASGARWLAGYARQELSIAGGRARPGARPGTLTAQEDRVAALAASGVANGDIARQLHVSVSTVETHLERVYAKLGIHTRYQLIARAVEASRDSK
jgi:DNA-binding CsgD family transcriptional regulator